MERNENKQVQETDGLLVGSREQDKLIVNILRYKDKDGKVGVLPVYPSLRSGLAEVYCPTDLTVTKGTAGCIPLGLGFELPEGYVLAFCPSTELFLKGLQIHPLWFEKKDPIVLPCVNLSGKDIELKEGDMIGSICFIPIARADNFSSRVAMQMHVSNPDDIASTEKNGN